jgi:endonuclease YncB( thermonuclease family)
MKTSHGDTRYPCAIVRAADGDTLVCAVALPFGVTITRPVRLTKLDSWELDGNFAALAIAARDVLTAELSDRLGVLIPSTRGLDCYGRIRGDILIDGHLVASAIVANGLGWWRGTGPAAPTTPPGATPPKFDALKWPWSHDHEARQVMTAAILASVHDPCAEEFRR